MLSKPGFRVALLLPPKGQGLAEYGLALGLLAVVCLVGLTAFGDGLRGLGTNLQAMLMGSGSDKTPAANPVNSTEATDTSTTASGNPSGALVPSGETVCMASNWCVNSPLALTGSAPDPQTAGANGVQMVNQYSDVLTQLAQIAAENPQIPSALALQITALADSGHSVANAELEAAHTWWINDTITQEVTDSANTAYSRIDDFTAQQNALLSALNKNPTALPPEVMQLINEASTFIQQQGNSFMSLDADQRDAIWRAVDASTTAVDDVHQNANTICTNGGDTTQCVQ
jgi:hypothetical protein